MTTDQHYSIKQNISNLRISTEKNMNVCRLSHMHFHEHIELLYVIEGAILCKHNQENFPLRKGEIIFFNSNVPHETHCIEDGTACALFQFHSPFLTTHQLSYLNDFLHISNTPIHVFTADDTDYDELKICLENMLNIDTQCENVSEYYFMANLFILYAILTRKGFISANELLADSKLINKIMPFFKYVDQNYGDQLSLDDMAKSVNFQKEYFCRLFKQATGSTVGDYLHFVRIRKAAQLLKSEMSTTEVAYQVGFTSASYFAKIFKKYHHCSPSDFKKIHKPPENLFYDEEM